MIYFTVGDREYSIPDGDGTLDAYNRDLTLFGQAVLIFKHDGTVEHIPLKDLPPDLLGRPVTNR
jgi:hypothetical protein